MKSPVTEYTAKEIAARKRVVRNMMISGLVIVLAIAGGLLSLTRHQEAVLIVTSRPQGAEVVLNFRATSTKTNAFLSDLPADSFIVSVRMDGYRPVPPEQGVRLKQNDTMRVTFLLSQIALEDDRELPKTDGRPYPWEWRHVRLTSEPSGAAIFLDDVRTGLNTPAEFLLPRGMHHLQAHWPNGAKAYKNIDIQPNASNPDVIFQPVTYVQPDNEQPKK